jgi:hypothetical protein
MVYGKRPWEKYAAFFWSNVFEKFQIRVFFPRNIEARHLSFGMEIEYKRNHTL